MGVTESTTVEDNVAHVKKLLTFGLPTKGAVFCHSVVCVCVLCPVLDSVKSLSGTPPDGRDIFSDAKARKLCSSNKKNLAQSDEA